MPSSAGWRTPTACGRTVSGSLSPRCPRCFSPFPHGTSPLSVSQEYLALPDGAGGFNRGFTDPGLLRCPAAYERPHVQDPHPLRCAFPCASARAVRTPCAGTYNPRRAATRRVWAVPLSLAATYGITLCFLLLRVLRCFSSPGSPPDLAEGVPRSPGAGCPIRKPADQIACADPRGLSQLGASFIASGSLGIPRAPLFTWNRPPARAGGPRRRPEGRLGGIAVSAQHVNEHAPGKTRHIAGTKPDDIKSESPVDSKILVLVEDNRFEPLTPCVQGRCSSQLS